LVGWGWELEVWSARIESDSRGVVVSYVGPGMPLGVSDIRGSLTITYISFLKHVQGATGVVDIYFPQL
jgi:hypothetical protein